MKTLINGLFTASCLLAISLNANPNDDLSSHLLDDFRGVEENLEEEEFLVRGEENTEAVPVLNEEEDVVAYCINFDDEHNHISVVFPSAPKMDEERSRSLTLNHEEGVQFVKSEKDGLVYQFIIFDNQDDHLNFDDEDQISVTFQGWGYSCDVEQKDFKACKHAYRVHLYTSLDDNEELNHEGEVALFETNEKVIIALVTRDGDSDKALIEEADEFFASVVIEASTDEDAEEVLLEDTERDFDGFATDEEFFEDEETV